MLSSADFFKSYLRLILMAWIVPAFVGLGFIIYIEVLSIDHIIGIVLSPWTLFFMTPWLIFVYWYFKRYIKPLMDHIETPFESKGDDVLECMRGFPFHFWFFFLIYLASAPTATILSAEHYAGFESQPIDWFRIHLVALIVSIIVGLPIFFMLLDLFGKVVGNLSFSRPLITVTTKVFLIGALVPLLIDTMIVQYYWTRTGFFTFETFNIWLTLELLAIVGSLIFTRSFGQALAPLEKLVEISDLDRVPISALKPMSTDEIGVLTLKFRDALVELHKNKESLEEIVNERTKELQRLNKEMEAFSYSVAHDLRSPLRAIDGFSQALVEDFSDVLDAEGHDYLRRIRGASQSMSGLIDDMLQLSRVSRSELVREKVDLTRIIHKVTENLKIAEKDRSVKFDIEQGLTCSGDKNLIKIVMDNLIGNAWKYTAKNNAAEIEIGKQEIDGREVFFVKDNGVGFDMQFADKLFGIFQRLHTTEEFEGAGIGLATVQRILHRHGGVVWAHSDLDEGATFYFTV